ncbi:ABC-type spermidine/putrescine transport system, permease component I [Hoeflea sp. IMCC20628]|uniref:ABC transporter permease n=1 Tax=Hoeflea sp. IMCC20628 TaxID=1620421 RepID=UPI00063BD8DD|nr:ABC transporter permease subunit [Hoeflea sp. IMCC20628]AKH99693.1 ABC-type spermidine/putrescine transport system, permease component I [Hoeflea sp. IMCC20628]
MKNLRIILLLLPVIVLYALLAGLPVIAIFVKSFTTNHNLDLEIFDLEKLRQTSWTLRNYGLLFTEPYYLVATWNTFVIAVVSVAISALLGVPIAFQLTREDTPGRRILEWITSLPIYLSGVLASYALLLFFSQRGALSVVSEALFGGAVRLPGTIAGVIAGTVYLILPMFVRISKAGFMAIHVETFEASLTLGANEFASFRKVMLPQALPAIGAAMAITFTYAMSLVIVILVLGSGGAKFTILPLEILAQTRSTSLNIPLAAAMAVVLLLIAAAGQYAAERFLQAQRSAQPQMRGI